MDSFPTSGAESSTAGPWPTERHPGAATGSPLSARVDSMILAMTGYQVVVSFHVMAAIAAFGVLFAYPVLLLVARSAGGPAAALHEGLVRTHRAVVTPAAVIVFATGIYLAIDADLFDRTWVSIPMAIIIILLGMVGAYFIPREKKMAALAADGGDGYEELNRQVAAVAVLAAVLVLVATFFMVAKP